MEAAPAAGRLADAPAVDAPAVDAPAVDAPAMDAPVCTEALPAATAGPADAAGTAPASAATVRMKAPEATPTAAQPRRAAEVAPDRSSVIQRPIAPCLIGSSMYAKDSAAIAMLAATCSDARIGVSWPSA